MRLKKGVVCVKRIYLWLLFLVLLIAPCTSVRADCNHPIKITKDDTGKTYTFKVDTTYQGNGVKGVLGIDSNKDWGKIVEKLKGYAGWFQCDKKADPSTGVYWHTRGYVPTKEKLKGKNYTLPSESSENYEEWRFDDKGRIKDPNNFGAYKDSEGRESYKNFTVDGLKDHRQGGETRTHTTFAINLKTARDWMDKAGIKADKKGNRILYLQPIIGRHDRSGITLTYSSDDARSLGKWKGLASYKNESTFWEHYNVPVAIKTEAKITIKYRPLTKGDV